MSIFDTGSARATVEELRTEVERLTTENSVLRAEKESLQARLDLFVDTLKEERARWDVHGKGGQRAGDNSPRMSMSMLHELEKLVKEEQGKYTYVHYLGMLERINALEKQLEEVSKR